MAKFVVVKSAPSTLEKGEIVLSPANFLEQIQENTRKAPKLKQTAISHLREVFNSIAAKYDPEMNVFKFRLVNYEGVPYKDDAELSNLVAGILRAEYPSIFDSYLNYQLKNRPIATKLIYYTGDFNTTGPFYKAGIDLLEDKDIEPYMTGKPKKVVGKPAITKQEAENNES